MKPDRIIHQPTQTRTQEIGFLLVPGFALMNFSAAVDPLHSANRISGKPLYNWTIITGDGKILDAGNGVSITPDCSMDEVDVKFDLVIICAGIVNQDDFKSRKRLDWIRKQARKGCTIGAISTGSEILANAGLLDGYRCTIHWENDLSFRENHPDAILTGGIYELDRKRITAAGGIASLDMMLNWISQTNGEFFASAIAEQFIYDHVRLPSQSQRNAEIQLVQRRSPRLAKAMQLMLSNTEEILSSKEISRQVGISTRQLERLFSKYRQKSLHRYYLDTRLDKARHLILYTGMTLLQISIATGFSSQSHFTRCYKNLFAKTPSSERNPQID
ncbi:MAG: GlxA family transcriptional regulator [Hyphomicrobiales bacterium]|nr:GlxA family transcriptional regulator [Hyphomicrobiales bacterium]